MRDPGRTTFPRETGYMSPAVGAAGTNPAEGRPIPWIQRGTAFLVLGICFLALVGPFVATRGFGEPDSIVIAAGLIQGGLTKEGPHWAGLYGTHFSVLYYTIAFALLDHVPLSAQQVVLWLNVANFAAGLASALLLLAVLRRVLPAEIAFLAAFGFVLPPAMWQLWTYGHPFGPALLATTAAIALYEVGSGLPPAFARGTAFVCAAALLAVGVGLRADAGLAVFAYASLLVFRRRLSWPVTRNIALSCIAGVAVFAGLRSFQAHASGERSSFVIGDVMAFLREYWQPMHVVSGLAFYTLAAGSGFVALLTWGTWMSARRREWRTSLAAAIWLAPAILFWLGNPSPPRHFALAAAGTLVWAVVLLSRWLSAASVARWVALGALVSFATPTAPPFSVASQSSLAIQLGDRAYWRHWQSRWDEFFRQAPASSILVGMWQDYGEMLLYEGLRGVPCQVEHVRLGKQRVVRVRSGKRELLWLESYSGAETETKLAALPQTASRPVVVARRRLLPHSSRTPVRLMPLAPE